MRKDHNLNLRFATNDPMLTIGQLELYLTFRYLLPKKIFSVVETLLVTILIETMFKDTYVTSICPTERRAKPIC